ncbi:nucleoside-diphosphate-sugar epimerase [Actimicrobium sp. GrIS 1.19]|uniref:NAD-dependent epimerase/dehydratase family protein n=1 Tax=Actimicrobium sp. GrIS 1.19 TaxID=3071708 RepID=UPI002DF80003|nr:nucleoside-diphosphate-sugar epimerase [Actimicrobium sp. GrIS 1.19]
MKIVVTGATGYIGSRLIMQGIASGHEMIMFSRTPPARTICAWSAYDLFSEQCPIVPAGTDVIVHLAIGTNREAADHGSLEILAARRLLDAGARVGAKMVFVSSQTAQPEAPTAYGRIKWQIEQIVLASGGAAVRPGQVYGGERRGLFGILVEMVQQMPILPAFIPKAVVQPIHVDDLVQCLLRASVAAPSGATVLRVGAAQPISFTDFLRTIARSRLRLRRWFVPVPVTIALRGLSLVGKGAQADRLRSLFALPVMDTAGDLARLQVQLRPLHSGMHRSGDDRRRRLLQEATALMSYVLRQRPPAGAARRYARAIEQLRSGLPLGLPAPCCSFPALLAVLDRRSADQMRWKAEFDWRLDAATVIGEATRSGARRFLGIGKRHGQVASLCGIGRAVFLEAGWRLASLVLAPLMRLACPRAFGEWQ